MSDKTPSVALFFDDAELGAHLRSALAEHGARIVHEGPLQSFDQTELQTAGTDVLVVNLDEAIDDATLERVYGLVGSDRIRVVFNDAQASRGLDGWDRARWARHLAVKALASNDIDPPRPDNARMVAAAPEPIAAPVDLPVEPEPIVVAAPAPEVIDTDEHHFALEDFAALPDLVEELPPEHQPDAPNSETLAAELEALLAADEPLDESLEDVGSGLKFSMHDELPVLHDGHFGDVAEDIDVDRVAAAVTAAHAPVIKVGAAESLGAPATDEAVKAPVFDLDKYSIASFEESAQVAPAAQASPSGNESQAPSAPEWGLLDDDAYEAPVTDKNFGVEKVSAQDYLAPDTEDDADAHSEPSMTLELVSIEEAIAPQHFYEPNEVHLQELETAFARLLVLGGARDSLPSLCAFLAVLPGDLRMPILLTHHLGSRSEEQLANALAAQSALPVKVAEAGSRARSGEVLLVPRGQQARVMRDGRVELITANDAEPGGEPSIDGSFTMAANVYGRDAVAIVFSGHATDAVAGSQAIHDRGGQVWVESSSGDHYADMVHGVLAERLASFSGSPQELAARLIEDYR